MPRPHVEIFRSSPVPGWHFVGEDHRLFRSHGTTRRRFGHRRRKVLMYPGMTLRVQPPVQLCVHGLHFSPRIMDAAVFARSSFVLCRVVGWGNAQRTYNKVAAQYRKVLWMADVEPTVREVLAACVRDQIRRAGWRASWRFEAVDAFEMGHTTTKWIDRAAKDGTRYATHEPQTQYRPTEAEWAKRRAARALLALVTRPVFTMNVANEVSAALGYGGQKDFQERLEAACIKIGGTDDPMLYALKKKEKAAC